MTGYCCLYAGDVLKAEDVAFEDVCPGDQELIEQGLSLLVNEGQVVES